MIVGITGTRSGATEPQLLSLEAELRRLRATEMHHGDCWGADAQANDIALDLGIPCVIHPPENLRYWADCELVGASVRLPPKGYIERNHDIVDACDVLIAVPRAAEERRSGTWATVRYARKVERPVTIIWPHGTIERSRDGL